MAAHKRAYGYRNDEGKIKLVSFRVSAVGVIEKPSLREYPMDANAPAPAPFTSRRVLFQGETDFIETGIYRPRGLRARNTTARPGDP